MNLDQSIVQLYSTFSKIEKPGKIIRFKCISCLDEKDEEYLLNTPLKKLNDHIFGGIMESCNAIEMGNECYKYYIPRILELLSIESFYFSFPFVEYVYRDFAKFNYTQTFNKEEIKAVDDFFYSFLDREFSKSKDDRDESEIFNIAETGFNAIPFLEKMQQNKDWSEIKKELDYHLLLQETKWAKSKSAFNDWANKGARKNLIDFLKQ